MTQAPATTVRRQLIVEAPLERGFAVFTERFGKFKPAEHNLLSVPIAETVFEPQSAVRPGVPTTEHTAIDERRRRA